MAGTKPDMIQVPIIAPTASKIKIAPIAAEIPLTIPASISFQAYPFLIPIIEAMAAPRIKAI